MTLPDRFFGYYEVIAGAYFSAVFDGPRRPALPPKDAHTGLHPGHISRLTSKSCTKYRPTSLRANLRLWGPNANPGRLRICPTFLLRHYNVNSRFLRQVGEEKA